MAKRLPFGFSRFFLMNFEENEIYCWLYHIPRAGDAKIIPSPGAGRARGGSSLSGEVGVLGW